MSKTYTGNDSKVEGVSGGDGEGKSSHVATVDNGGVRRHAVPIGERDTVTVCVSHVKYHIKTFSSIGSQCLWTAYCWWEVSLNIVKTYYHLL